MSTGARKARKRAGLKHPKIGAVKVGTALQDRAWALAARVEKPTRETRKLMKGVR